MQDKRIVGVDVSKDWLDISLAGKADVERIANEPAAIAAWLERTQPALIAFEPTGGYERALRQAARTSGVLFMRVHPNRVMAFRQSRGIKAKTDRIDARLIADFAADELARRAPAARPTTCCANSPPGAVSSSLPSRPNAAAPSSPPQPRSVPASRS